MANGRVGRLIRAVVVLCILGSSPIRADEPLTRALESRSAGKYAEAIVTLRQLVSEDPQRSDYQLLLAETLAWDHQFEQAERVYRTILSDHDQSREARLGLARTLLWEGEYREAIPELDRLLTADPGDLEALEARATADYWSGDFRSAARRFQRVLRADPNRAVSRTSLDQIRLASRPKQWMAMDDLDDDQPYRMTRAEIGVTVFSDPLTRWSVVAGDERASAPRYGARTLPFLDLSNRTVVPAARLTLAPNLGIIRYADGTTGTVGGLSLSRRLTQRQTLELSADRRALAVTATGLATHPSVDTVRLEWKRESDDGWSAAVQAASLRYFDGNRGVSAWAWGLVPLFHRETLRIRAGLAVSSMDTDQSRFRIAAAASIRNGEFFDYTYRGEYSPYWTPQNLREARVVLVAARKLGRVGIELHADAGLARDEGVAFGPSSGAAPLPSSPFRIPFDRQFHPFRTELTATIPLRQGLTLQTGLEIGQTAFYRARNFHVSLVRHH